MKYTDKDLFAFMDEKRPVRITCTTGETFVGLCWAHSAVAAEEEYGIREPILEIGSTILLASEIEKIEFAD